MNVNLPTNQNKFKKYERIVKNYSHAERVPVIINNNSNNNEISVGDGEETDEGIDRTSASAVSNSEEQGEQSHLIVWQVQCPMPATNA